MEHLTGINLGKREEIAHRIRALRKEKKLSQEAFAEAIGYHKKTIRDWERADGKNRIPQLEMMHKLCEFFECDMGHILCEYDYKVHSLDDAGKITGLSEESLDILAYLNDKVSNADNSEDIFSKRFHAMHLRLIDEFIKNSFEMAEHFSNYRSVKNKRFDESTSILLQQFEGYCLMRGISIDTQYSKAMDGFCREQNRNYAFHAAGYKQQLTQAFLNMVDKIADSDCGKTESGGFSVIDMEDK